MFAFAALGALVVALGVAWKGRPRLPAVALAVYLVGLAWFLVLPALAWAGWTEAATVGALVTTMHNIVGNTALAAFAASYAQTSLKGRRSWVLLWAATPGAVALFAFAVVPAAFVGDGLAPTVLASNFGRLLHNVAALVGIVVLGRRFFTSAAGPLRQSLLYVLLAFSGFGINHVFADAARMLGSTTAFGSASPPVVAVSIANTIALTLVAVATTRRLRHDGDPVLRRLLWALTSMTALASLQLFWWSQALALHQVLDTVIVGLLAYAVARGYVLDIDLRVKWTLKRGTVAGGLAVAFFVAKESVEAFLPGEGAVAGVAGAGVVALLAYPAWLGASRLTERFMPSTVDTAEYRGQRARELYQAALEGALKDGVITGKERDILDGLRRSLGIPEVEATEIERTAAATKVTN